MTNFEVLERTIIDWKAFLAIAEVNRDGPHIRHYQSGLGALESAMKKFKQPSNTQIQQDTKPKHNYRNCGASMHLDGAEYCYQCGGRL